MKNAKNVLNYVYGSGAIHNLASILQNRLNSRTGRVVYFVDEFFQSGSLVTSLPCSQSGEKEIVFVSTTREPTTDLVDQLCTGLMTGNASLPEVVVGIGGGSVLDVTKAVANLLTNGGQAHEYQGWDLVRVPAVYKIGIPTLSGTGAEASRTCVLTNPHTGVKLGMNSDHSVFDQLLLDPDLTATVPRNQYFFSGMDTYLHCIESLAGRHRHAVADAFSAQALALIDRVFNSGDMMQAENRGNLMVASYLGGCAIANSLVGVLHPFSAGLSVVLGMHHGVANCVAMQAMTPFYPEEVQVFQAMAARQGMIIPGGFGHTLTDTQHDQLYQSTVVHEKPLANALGDDFRTILTRERVRTLFASL
ncbi:MAG: iron-containing alcohol dehydrogenase family protein [Magnetococcus sp. DMHC-1]